MGTTNIFSVFLFLLVYSTQQCEKHHLRIMHAFQYHIRLPLLCFASLSPCTSYFTSFRVCLSGLFCFSMFSLSICSSHSFPLIYCLFSVCPYGCATCKSSLICYSCIDGYYKEGTKCFNRHHSKCSLFFRSNSETKYITINSQYLKQ